MNSPGRRSFLQIVLAAAVTACAAREEDQASEEAAVHGAPIAKSDPILILGAGISGLAAAGRLVAKGFTDVTILEARDRIGGRMYTDRSLGVPFDLGAAWLQSAGDAGNPLGGLLRGLGVTPVPTDWNNQAVYDAEAGLVETPVVDDAKTKFEAQFRAAVSAIGRLRDQSVPLSNVLDPLLAPVFTTPDQKRLLRFLLASYVVNEYAAMPSEVAAWEFSDWTKDASDDRLVGGYDVLLQSLAKNLRIRLGEVVRSVTYDARGATVVTSSDTYRAAAVLVTLPVGVLRANAVTFSPPLPADKTAAIAAIGFGAFEKVVLLYDQPFWPASTVAFGYASDDPAAATMWINAHALNGPPALVAMYTGDAAKAVADLDDDALRTNALAQVSTMFGSEAPAPTGFLRTNWNSDPYARGVYTYPSSANLEAQIKAIAKPVGRRVFFAGEATHQKYYSYAHGAYLSGLRAADEIG